MQWQNFATKDDACKKGFLWRVCLMADGAALDGWSRVRKRRLEAVRGSKRDTFIGRDTASSRCARFETQMCSKQPALWICTHFFWKIFKLDQARGGKIWQAAFCRAFIQICNYPKCISPHLHLGAGQFQIPIFQLLIQLFWLLHLLCKFSFSWPTSLLSQYVIRAFRL